DNERWERSCSKVAEDLVAVTPVFLGLWIEGFRPIKGRLQPHLASIFRDQRPERTAERSLATIILADFTADQPSILADLLMDADERQFALLLPKLKEHGESGLSFLLAESDKRLPADAKEEAKEHLARRQATALVALLHLGQPEKLWPLLTHGTD